MDVPVNIGVGPAVFGFGNPSFTLDGLQSPIVEDQPWHYGLRLRLAARIDYEFVKQNPRVVPKQYRDRFTKDTVVYYRPMELIFIPRELMISPGGDSQIYGATWSFIGGGIPMTAGNARLTLGADLLLTYAYIGSDVYASPTHFLRPGISIGPELRVDFTRRFAMSLGWDSSFYIPQQIGGGVFSMGGDAPNLWHIGQGYLQFHFIVPYSTSL